jgi:RecA/RadA recombinase
MKMNTQFKPATKSQSKLRAAIYGPSGSGKTYTALSMAKGIGGKVAVIDTEYGSASKYADRFSFDTINLTVPTVENYQELIVQAGKLGYSVCIIDSMSHGWQ